jgi:hypothetical protein
MSPCKELYNEWFGLSDEQVRIMKILFDQNMFRHGIFMQKKVDEAYMSTLNDHDKKIFVEQLLSEATIARRETIAFLQKQYTTQRERKMVMEYDVEKTKRYVFCKDKDN